MIQRGNDHRSAEEAKGKRGGAVWRSGGVEEPITGLNIRFPDLEPAFFFDLDLVSLVFVGLALGAWRGPEEFDQQI